MRAATTRRRSRPQDAGSYQWVASYSGDAANNGVANACNDPKEQSNVAVTVVQASCIQSPVVLRGLSAKVRRTLTASVTALGVKSVTFYLDGRKLKTVTKPKNQRYAIKVSVRGLGYGRHRLQVRVKTRDASCSAAAVAAAFVKVRSPVIRPEVHRLARRRARCRGSASTPRESSRSA